MDEIGNTIQLSKNVVSNMLLNNEENIKLIKPTNARSTIWERFNIIVYKNNKQNLVQCTGCKQIVSYKSLTGTATLLRHRCEYFPEPIPKPHNTSYEEAHLHHAEKDEISIDVKEEVFSEGSSDIVCDTSNINFDSNPHIQIHPNTYESLMGSLAGYTALQLQSQKGDQNLFSLNFTQKSVGQSNSDLLSKEEVEMRFKNGDSELTFERPTNSRHSDTWHRFEIVFYQGIRQNFAKCIECNSFVSYKKTTGTASLIRHKCRGPKTVEVVPDSLVDLLRTKTVRTSTPTSAATTSVTSTNVTPQNNSVQGLERKSHQSKIISDSVFSNLIESQIKFVSKGLYSTEILSDPNFLSFAQNLVHIGAQYGNQNIETLLNRKSIIEDVMPRLLNVTQQRLRESLKNTDFTISFRNWEDRELNQYVTIFCYYLDDDFNYKHAILATKPIDEQDSVSSVIQSVCKEDFGYAGKQLKCVLNIPTTNYCDTNNFEAFPCMVAVFGQIISETFNENSFYFRSVYEAILERIGGGKSYEIATSDDKLKVFYKYSQILKENPEKSDTLLGCFYKYFGAIFSAIASIQNSQKITINEIFLWFRRFFNIYVEKNPSDMSENILRSVAENIKEKQTVLTDLHRIAVFLDPNFKNLKFLEHEERTKLLEIIKRQLQEIIDSNRESSVPSKKLKLEQKNDGSLTGSYSANETFLEFMDISMENDEDLAMAEIQRYMGFKLENPTNLTEFWRTIDSFPNLKILAKNLLNVPSCSFHNNCCFLTTDSLLYTRSKNLMPEEIECLTFLHQNLNE